MVQYLDLVILCQRFSQHGHGNLASPQSAIAGPVINTDLHLRSEHAEVAPSRTVTGLTRTARPDARAAQPNSYHISSLHPPRIHACRRNNRKLNCCAPNAEKAHPKPIGHRCSLVSAMGLSGTKASTEFGARLRRRSNICRIRVLIAENIVRRFRPTTHRYPP